jgi:hypothetical protein
LADYQERVVGDKFVALERLANAKQAEAVDQLGRSNFTEAIAAYSEARDICGQIGGDMLLVGYPAAESFLQAFCGKVDALRVTIAEKQRERSLSDCKREVESAMDQAASDFEHHRDEMSLEKLNVARDRLDGYETEFGPDEFVAQQQQAQRQFEVAYAARVFEAELSRRERKVVERRGASSSAAANHRNEEAVRLLQEADDACQDLGTDPRFLHLERVSSFLREHHAAAAAQRAAIAGVLRERAASEATRVLRDNISECTDMYAHSRWEDSLASAVRAEDRIEEYTNSNVLEDVATFSEQLVAFKKKFQEERLADEAEAQIRGVGAILSNAEFLLQHHRHEDCMKAMQQARDEASTLAASKYAGLPSVASFFAGWPERFLRIQQELQGKLFKVRVRDATADVRSALREAVSCVSHSMNERAMAALHKARDLLEVLAADSDLSSLATVVTFVAQSTAEATALSQQIADDLFAREVDEAIRNAGSKKDRAQHYFSRCAYELSLQEFNAAKEIVEMALDDARLSSSAKLAAFVASEFGPFCSAFSATYAATVLADEARKVAGIVKGHLGRCSLYLERNAREQCLEELAEAQDAGSIFKSVPSAAGEGAPSMLSSLPIAAEVLALTADVHQKVSLAFLQADYDTIVRSCRKTAARVHSHQSKLLDATDDLEALKEELSPLLGSDAAREPVCLLYAAVPTASDFLAREIRPLFKAAGQNMYQDASAALAKKKSGGGVQSDPDADPCQLGKALASRWPQVAVLRKGVPSINIGPDVHPRYFTALKVLNQQAVNVKAAVKDLEKTIAAWDLSGVPRQMYEWMGRSFEPMDRYVANYAKGLGGLEADLTAEVAKEDAVYQQLATGFSKFTTGWAETKSHFNAAQKTLLHYRFIRQGITLIQTHLEVAMDVSNSQSCISAEFNGFIMPTQHLPFSWYDMIPPGCSFNFSGVPQDQMFVFLIRGTDALLDAVDSYARQEKTCESFPNLELFKKEIADTRTAAKREHAQHCVRRICQTASSKDDSSRKAYFDVLRKFPLARKAAVELGNEYAYDNERRYGRPWFKPLLEDPLAGDDTADPEETAEWYARTWTWVLDDASLGGPNRPFDKKKDQSTSGSSKVYTAKCKANAGKIVFSNALIESTGEGGAIADTFDLKAVTEGKGLFARAFWPRAISNYPIAKDNASGKLLYGPAAMSNDRMHCEILLMASIDGEQILNEELPNNAVSAMDQRSEGGAGAPDFYALNQTCRLQVLADDLDDIDQLRDSWHRVAGRFAYEFSKLTAGDHKVELQLCFRLNSTVENAFSHPKLDEKDRLWPFFTTPVSTPIAQGAFTLNVPATKVPRRSVLPKPMPFPSLPAAKRSAIESAILATLAKSGSWGNRADKTEVPFYCTLLEANSHVCSTEVFVVSTSGRERVLVKEAVQYSQDFRGVFRRRVADGWHQEKVAFFLLAAAGAERRDPPRDVHEPVCGIHVAMGQYFEIDACLLSESDLLVLERAPVRRAGGNA